MQLEQFCQTLRSYEHYASSKFEQNLHNSKFDAITAIASLQGVTKLVQIYFFVLCDGCFTFSRRRIDLSQYLKMLSRLVASRQSGIT